MYVLYYTVLYCTLVQCTSIMYWSDIENDESMSREKTLKEAVEASVRGDGSVEGSRNATEATFAAHCRRRTWRTRSSSAQRTWRRRKSSSSGPGGADCFCCWGSLFKGGWSAFSSGLAEAERSPICCFRHRRRALCHLRNIRWLTSSGLNTLYTSTNLSGPFRERTK